MPEVPGIIVTSYKVSAQGKRGYAMTLPKRWVDDLSLKTGDSLDIYRDEHDRLIIVPAKKNDHH